MSSSPKRNADALVALAVQCGRFHFALTFALGFLLAMPAAAVTEKVIYAFHGSGDGALPYSNLVLDKAGNLYGTTYAGGSPACDDQYGILGCGTIFELSPNADGSWTQTLLYSFQGGSDGINPEGIVFDKLGNIYGVTESGGGANAACYRGCGTVFELTRSHGVWKESVIYHFQGGSDGYEPGGVVLDAVGNLLGTTYIGGDLSCGPEGYGCGVAFELSPSGTGTWNESLVHTFGVAYPDGQNANGGLVLDSKGAVYGSTANGGTDNAGTVFSLTSSPGGWTENVLFSFSGASGVVPVSGVIFGPAGRLYGATYNGGNRGGGTFFEVFHGAKGWGEAVVLPAGGPLGGNTPVGLLSTDSSGNLYGTTQYGGTSGWGTVYKMTPNGSGWTGAVLYSFPGGADGSGPISGTVEDSTGKIYGTTWVGGTGSCDPQNGIGCGVVFEITP